MHRFMELYESSKDPITSEFIAEDFYHLIIEYACVCVKDVLSDILSSDEPTLTYDAAEEVQNRIKEFFEV